MFIAFKKFLSSFLTIVIIFLLIPCVSAKNSIPQISSHAELSNFLNGDLTLSHAVLSDDIILSVDEYSEYLYNVAKTATLDLNGYSIKITNNSHLYSQHEDSTLFKINTGYTFTIIDSSNTKTGSIEHIGAIIPTPTHDDKNPITAIASVNAFIIDEGASLVLNDITVSAGNYEKQWLHDAISISGGGFRYDSAITTQVVCGTVVTVNSGAELTINGGRYTCHGRSRGNSLPNIKGWDDEKPASVCVRALEGARIRINDGCFYGNYGADVFDLHSNSDSLIKSGTFETSPVINERAADFEGRHSYISGEYYGSIELPLWAVPAVSRKSFYKNSNKLDTSNTPVIRDSNGETISLKPSTNTSASLESEGIITSYSIGNAAYIHADYTPYFDSGSTISYEWYVLLPDSTQKTLSFTGKTLNLQFLSKSNEINFQPASEYEFGCIVTEEFKLTNSYVLTTFSKTFTISTSDKKVIPSISLTPSDINSGNKYKCGKIPSFNAPKNANYDITDVNWYALDLPTYDNVTELLENSDYQIVIELSAKNGYHFSADSRVSFLPGGENITVVPSNDGSTAKVYAVLITECTHTSTRTIYDHVKHSITCNICGDILLSESHVFSAWTSNESQANVQTRSCLVCSHIETTDFCPNDTDNLKIIPSVTIDFGQIYYSNSPKNIVPKLYDTPLNKYITILNHSWSDADGNSVNKFEFDIKYILTVELSLNDTEAFKFSNELTVLSLYNSTVSVTVSEDGTTATAKFSVYTLKEVVSNLTLPKVNVGHSIVASLPQTPLSYFTLIWAENGCLIGCYDFINGKASNITDLNEDDGIDFSTYTFNSDSVYTLYVDWDTYHDSLVIYEGKGNVRLDISNADEYSFLKGFTGTLIAKYDMRTKKNYIPIISVNGITPPDTNTTPDKTATTADVKYKIMSVKWTYNDTAFNSFACLKRYTVHVTVKLNAGYEFSSEKLCGTINGLEANIVVNGNEAVISFTFDPIEHHINKDKNIIHPSCELDGSITATCSACGYMNSLTVKKTSHTAMYRRTKTATCNESGYSAHYFCVECQDYYTDVNRNNVTFDDIITESSGHSPLGNCFDSKHHYDVCSFCYAITNDKTEHTLSEAVLMPDRTAYKTCACGYIFYFTPILDEQTGGPDMNISTPNGLSIEKMKTLIIAAIAFLILVFLLILIISAYLIITRKSYKALLIQISDSSSNVNENNTGENAGDE